MTDSVLKIEALEKTFGGDYALGPLTLDLVAGDSVALFGKNGAGKTTLFQIITGSLDATNGKVTLNGKKMVPEAYQLKREIGYLPQDLGFPRWVNGQELLTYATRLYELGNEKDIVSKALAFWDCEGFRTRPLAACSHGMQKRIGLALSTLHNPKLLILDEPFSGLDLFHIRALIDTIRARAQAQLTTIISTHVAPYAATLCNKALLLEAGKMSSLGGWSNADAQGRVDLVEAHFFGEKSGANH